MTDLPLEPPAMNNRMRRDQLLIIDDEEEVLRALYRQFRRDYDVHLASSAEAGYRIMTEFPVYVIISDQRMPGMNGTDFFGKIKTEFPDAVRLLLTGYSDIQAVIAAINDGNIFRYIMKPWDPLELDTIVREAFERYHLLVENRLLLIKLQQANSDLEARVAARTAELADANERLRTLNAQKDQLLGMAAHDMRTPITVIQGFTDLLLHPRTAREHLSEFAQIIRQTLDQMLALLNDLLDITAIESGRLTLRPQAVHVPGLIERTSKLNRYLAERKEITLVTDLTPDLPTAVFDPGRIEQVLDNLLSNAFKYSHSGTIVTLSVRMVEEEQIEFSVADQGQGIPADEIDKLFGEFQRVSTRPTGDESSTGLGLSICRRIVELHGGVIGVESTVGVGSRFFFRLPLQGISVESM